MTHGQITDAAAANSTSHNSGVFLVFAIVLIAVALVQLINPRLTWRLRSKTLRHPEMSEPSSTGFVLIRISAAVVLCAAVVMILEAVNAI